MKFRWIPSRRYLRLFQLPTVTLLYSTPDKMQVMCFGPHVQSNKSEKQKRSYIHHLTKAKKKAGHGYGRDFKLECQKSPLKVGPGFPEHTITVELRHLQKSERN